MITAVLVDDEPLGRKRLRRLLLDHPDVEVVAEAANGREARAAVLTRRPDVLFLDVQMPAEDGPTALRMLRETLPEGALPFVIFTTAHAEHAIDAFALEALDYLLKPVERSGLARALKRVRKRRSDAPEVPTAPAMLKALRGNRTIPLALDDVSACLVEDETVWALTADGRYRLEGTLKEVSDRLPKAFVQVSRAAVLRVDRIAELRPGASGTLEAVLKGVDDVVHVSRRRGRELRKLFGG